ncbi:MAG TPA: TolC family protein [Caldithrix sp.]|nr:TolC family protein [Caldithrix sp.]
MKQKMKRIIGLYILLFFFIKPGWGQQSSGDLLELSLTQAIQEALKQNDQLQSARARLQGAEAGLNEASGALLPKINANLTYSYLDIVPGFKKIKLGNIQNDFIPTVSVKQPLFTGGKLKNGKKAAQAAVESQRLSFENDELSLKLTISLAYFQLLSLDNQIQILQENRRQLQVQQQYARLLVEAGRMSQLELNRLQVELADLDGRLLKLHNDYQLISHNLAVAMGKPEQVTFVPTDSLLVEPLPADTSRLFETALEKNPNWKKYDWEMRRAEAKINIQKAARMPQVSATAWYGYEFGLESFSFDKNKRYYVGLTAAMPIFDGGVIRAKSDQALSQLEQVKWQREYFRKALSAQVKNLFLRVKETETLIGIQQQAVDQARQSYRLALIEYHAGRRSNTDLLDIQKALLNSRLQLNEAIVNYNRSRVQMLYTLGLL